jgi:hypothetical protein
VVFRPFRETMANYSTGMLANLNGQDNYFDPPAATEAAPAAAEETAEETGEAMFPPQDPTGTSVLQKTLLPFDDHPYAQVRRRARSLLAPPRLHTIIASCELLASAAGS